MMCREKCAKQPRLPAMPAMHGKSANVPMVAQTFSQLCHILATLSVFFHRISISSNDLHPTPIWIWMEGVLKTTARIEYMNVRSSRDMSVLRATTAKDARIYFEGSRNMTLYLARAGKKKPELVVDLCPGQVKAKARHVKEGRATLEVTSPTFRGRILLSSAVPRVLEAWLTKFLLSFTPEKIALLTPAQRDALSAPLTATEAEEEAAGRPNPRKRKRILSSLPGAQSPPRQNGANSSGTFSKLRNFQNFCGPSLPPVVQVDLRGHHNHRHKHLASLLRASKRHCNLKQAPTPKDHDDDQKGDENLPPPDEHQTRVLDAVAAGRNVFFTGCAGTGKSALIRHIVHRFGKPGSPSLHVTAATGIAACLVGGRTIHAWAGVSARDEGKSISDILGRMENRPGVVTRWLETAILVVDEVSMLHPGFLDLLDSLGRAIRSDQSHLAFGGIQLVFCGDFLQLPPVHSSSVPHSAPKFAFEAKSWEAAQFTPFQLTKVYRQEDIAFASILGDIRLGQVTDRVKSALASRASDAAKAELQELEARTGVQPTRLLSHAAAVNATNSRMLDELPGTMVVYQSHDILPRGATRAVLDGTTPVSSSVALKVGAQVILLRNLDVSAGLANGSRGVVIRFDKGTHLPWVRFTNGAEHLIPPSSWRVRPASGGSATRLQVPLSLGFAITVHRAQGISLDLVSASLGQVFEAGQAYVALSRARTLSGLVVENFDPAKVYADWRALKFYRKLTTSRK